MPMVFVYGPDSLQARIYDRLGPSEVLGGALLEGWGLVFNKPQMKGPEGLANLVERPGALTFGVLYDLTRKQIEMLEGYYGGYQPRDLKVKPIATEGDAEAAPKKPAGPVEAAVYVARRIKDGLKPAKESVSLTLKGGEENGAPPAFLQEVKTWLTAN